MKREDSESLCDVDEACALTSPSTTLERRRHPTSATEEVSGSTSPTSCGSRNQPPEDENSRDVVFFKKEVKMLLTRAEADVQQVNFWRSDFPEPLRAPGH